MVRWVARYGSGSVSYTHLIVRWSLSAMIEAEEYGVTSKNVDEQAKSDNPNIKRILGVTPGGGANLGLDEKWAYNIVKQVGNYGESLSLIHI